MDNFEGPEALERMLDAYHDIGRLWEYGFYQADFPTDQLRTVGVMKKRIAAYERLNEAVRAALAGREGEMDFVIIVEDLGRYAQFECAPTDLPARMEETLAGWGCKFATPESAEAWRIPTSGRPWYPEVIHGPVEFRIFPPLQAPMEQPLLRDYVSMGHPLAGWRRYRGMRSAWKRDIAQCEQWNSRILTVRLQLGAGLHTPLSAAESQRRIWLDLEAEEKQAAEDQFRRFASEA